MPRLAPTDWKTQEAIFEAHGFTFERQKGSHRSYTKDGVSRPVIIPTYSEIGVDIIKNNMRTAGMTRTRYFALLAKAKS
jgi:predicted RNA binding protein YcfA (HicA-like mRNA interferase family)